jgi:uncharacterized protein YjbI with pentapeptide repeats
MFTTPIVPPRVYSSTGEKMLLVDCIETIMASRDRAVMRLVGAGKSTTIRYLQDVFAAMEHISVEDDDSELVTLAFRPYVVTSRVDVDADYEFKLLGWDRDDFIEYLLSQNPAACKSVLESLGGTSATFCDGSPEVWSYVLDRLSIDPTVSVEDIALQYLKLSIAEELYASNEHLEQCIDSPEVTAVCESLSGHFISWQVDVALALVDRIIGGRKIRRLLGHAEVRCELIGETLARRLVKRDKAAVAVQVPGMAIKACAKRIRESSRVLKFLKSVVTKAKSSALAASLLRACEPGWKPPNLSNVCFDDAHLPDVRWSAVKLVRCSFHRANLRHGDFQRAILSQSSFVGATLANADLSGAELTQANLRRANLANSTLSGAVALKSSWDDAVLRNAHFDESNLGGARFNRSDLGYASFVRCDLRETSFCRATMDGVDLSFANCWSANFSFCDLRTALLSEARCAYARFMEANFEDANLHSIVLTDAKCPGAIFSGSRMRGANLRNAVLVGARMAEVDWEDCDLRGADLQNCDFHYGSTRCGLVDSPYPSHGTRTGFYTDDYDDRYYRRPEEIRKANLCGCDLRGARIENTDFYLVDLRGAKLNRSQRKFLTAAGAILN